MTKVVDTPYFVDSKFTTGIQLADLVASVVRQYEEADLSRKAASDEYLSSIARYYEIIATKTRDMADPDSGILLNGLHIMPEHLHYFTEEEHEIG